MTRGPWFDARSPLGLAMPTAQYGDILSTTVEVPLEKVWDRLHTMRWSDLPSAAPLRQLGRFGVSDRSTPCMATSEHQVSVEDEPAWSMRAMVGKPLLPYPFDVNVTRVHELQAFNEPGWLKMGAEWLMHPLTHGRTGVKTRTMYAPTDPGADRQFSIAWKAIRPLSARLRNEMIELLGRP